MKSKHNLKTAFFIVVLVLFNATLYGQLLMVENFSISSGEQLINHGWSGHSGNGTNNISVVAASITYSGYTSSGIGNEVFINNTGQDVNKTFAEQTDGGVYASFIVNINSATTGGDYFFHFGRTSIGTDFRGRVFVRRNASNKLAFGVSQSTTTANFSDFLYDLNTTYLIVVKYNIVPGSTNDYTQIIINPSLTGTEPSGGWISSTDASGTDLSNIGSIALRQGTSSTSPTLLLDGIRIGKNWTDITGNIPTPSLSVSNTSLSGFSYIVDKGPSTTQSFLLQGTNLSTNVSIAATNSFEISLQDGNSFTAQALITLTPQVGVVNQNIFVRMKQGLAIGQFLNQNIAIASSGAQTIGVQCSGEVFPTPEPPQHVTNFSGDGISTTAISLQWTDAVPSADYYLIKASDVDFGSIAAPMDGMAVADGLLVKNIAAGNGSVVFTNLTSNKTYYFSIFPYNGSGVNINYKTSGVIPQTSVATLGSPAVEEIIMPQFIQGKAEPNNLRVPFAYRLKLQNLNPNTTYRYVNQVVLASDNATFFGAANCIFVNPDNTFTRTTTTNLSIAGNYGVFTTDASGSYIGWFITEPTGNDRFAPGNELFIRLRLNDGNNGTTAVTFLTTTSPIKVIGYATNNNNTSGTAIRAESDANPRNFVFLYENENGTGRPIYGTSVEATGSDFAATVWAPFYRQKVVGRNGAWGGIVPNNSLNGVKRIEERSLLNGTIIKSAASSNGIWGTTNTVQPTGGLNDVLVIITGIAPVTAVNDYLTTLVNESISIEPMANDIAGSSPINYESFAFIPATAPNPLTQGTFTYNPANAKVTFTPVSGYLGNATISYRICDLNQFCDTAIIEANVIVGLTNLYPATGPGTLAFEDLWPGKGDYDFNDLVIDYQFELISNPSNYLEQIKATFTIKAFGASFENGFGFQLEGNFEPFDLTVSGHMLSESFILLEPNGLEADQTKPTIIVFDNAFALMPHPGTGIGVNTDPAAPYVQPVTVEMHINFKPDTYTINDVNIGSFNPFLIVNKNRSHEIHLPNYPPTDLVDMSLFGTWEDNSNPATGRWYVNDKNLPWAINIYESFAYPIEKQEILWAHLKFAAWAMSGGVQFPDWYKNLTGHRNSSLIYQVPAAK